MSTRQTCANDNHGRSVVTVRFCPGCGGGLNRNIAVKRGAAETHARLRRSRSTFCFNCGERLLQVG
jgi:hypothetical protein